MRAYARAKRKSDEWKDADGATRRRFSAGLTQIRESRAHISLLSFSLSSASPLFCSSSIYSHSLGHDRPISRFRLLSCGRNPRRSAGFFSRSRFSVRDDKNIRPSQLSLSLSLCRSLSRPRSVKLAPRSPPTSFLPLAEISRVRQQPVIAPRYELRLRRRTAPIVIDNVEISLLSRYESTGEAQEKRSKGGGRNPPREPSAEATPRALFPPAVHPSPSRSRDAPRAQLISLCHRYLCDREYFLLARDFPAKCPDIIETGRDCGWSHSREARGGSISLGAEERKLLATKTTSGPTKDGGPSGLVIFPARGRGAISSRNYFRRRFRLHLGVTLFRLSVVISADRAG